MKSRKNRKAFTLVELLVVLAIIAILSFIVIGLPVFLRGNFWFSEIGVLREIQVENPEIVKISKVNRNVFSLSEIYVKDVNDVSSVYRLDTCVFFNYDLRPSK